MRVEARRTWVKYSRKPSGSGDMALRAASGRSLRDERSQTVRERKKKEQTYRKWCLLFLSALRRSLRDETSY